MDLLGLATFDTDKSFTVELQLQEDLQKYGNSSSGGTVILCSLFTCYLSVKVVCVFRQPLFMVHLVEKRE